MYMFKKAKTLKVDFSYSQ